MGWGLVDAVQIPDVDQLIGIGMWPLTAANIEQALRTGCL